MIDQVSMEGWKWSTCHSGMHGAGRRNTTVHRIVFSAENFPQTPVASCPTSFFQVWSEVSIWELQPKWSVARPA